MKGEHFTIGNSYFSLTTPELAGDKADYYFRIAFIIYTKSNVTQHAQILRISIYLNFAR